MFLNDNIIEIIFGSRIYVCIKKSSYIFFHIIYILESEIEDILIVYIDMEMKAYLEYKFWYSPWQSYWIIFLVRVFGDVMYYFRAVFYVHLIKWNGSEYILSQLVI